MGGIEQHDHSMDAEEGEVGYEDDVVDGGDSGGDEEDVGDREDREDGEDGDDSEGEEDGNAYAKGMEMLEELEGDDVPSSEMSPSGGSSSRGSTTDDDWSDYEEVVRWCTVHNSRRDHASVKSILAG